MKDLQETVTLAAHHRDGYHYEVSEDPDGLGCVQISYIDEDGERKDTITLGPNEAEFVAKAIPTLLAFFRNRDGDTEGRP